MTTTFRTHEDLLAEIVRKKARRELAERDLSRSVLAGQRGGLTQAEIAAGLDVSQAAVSKKLAQAKPLDGDDSPYDVALRYASGEVDQKAMLEKLSGFSYAPKHDGDAYDEPFMDVPQSTDELTRAHDKGFLSDIEYDQILAAIRARTA